MLSLSLSAAVMLWGYINNLNERNKPGDGGYSGGSGSYKVLSFSWNANWQLVKRVPFASQKVLILIKVSATLIY